MSPLAAEQVNTLVQRSFAYEGYQRWFAVLFYFAVKKYRLELAGLSPMETSVEQQLLISINLLLGR